MMRRPRHWLVGLALLLATRGLDAQVVRGTVRERASNEGLSGTGVELLSQAPSGVEVPVAAVLSDDRGAFALQAPAPGRFVLVVKRIGVRRFRSDRFVMRQGETINRDVSVDRLLFTLPEVLVSATTACSSDPREGERVAALWDEARTALLATQLSLRDRLYRARVTHYVRVLDPRSHRVTRETRSQADGIVAQPFSAVPPETLSARGYWIPSLDGGATYRAPNAETLLSEEFLADHCFFAVPPRRNRQGLVGLGFAPGVARRVPDIVGTLWLDEKSFELRFVEFAYSQVQPGVDSASIGGELHFARLPTGAWIVRRWFLRTPGHGRLTSPVVAEETTSPWVLVRPLTPGLREEGGDVAAEALRPRLPPPSRQPNDTLRRPR